MADSELDALRAKRLAELQQQQGGQQRPLGANQNDPNPVPLVDDQTRDKHEYFRMVISFNGILTLTFVVFSVALLTCSNRPINCSSVT